MWLRRIQKQSIVVAAATVVILGLALSGKAPLGHAQQKAQGSLDLVGGLKAVPGCLGVETAQTASGKKVIFAWFEDKNAVLRWYDSDMHQGAMKMLLGDRKPDPPLQGVPDDIGPVLVIASLTMSDLSLSTRESRCPSPRSQSSCISLSQVESFLAAGSHPRVFIYRG